jgi:RNA recognition motif-containing protein
LIPKFSLRPSTRETRWRIAPTERDPPPQRTAPSELDSPPAQPAEKSTPHVSGIPKGTTQDDLQAVFRKYNPVEIRIMREDSDGRRGFAFV